MNNFINFLSKLNNQSQVIKVNNYENNYGEKSNYILSFRDDYFSVVRSALKIWKSYSPRPSDCKEFNYGALVNAQKELIDSFEKTLRGSNPNYTLKDIYYPVFYKKKKIEGIKVHRAQNILHLDGIVISKIIIEPARYPIVEHSELTLAKNFLRKKTFLSRYRQFKLISPKLGEIEIRNHIFTAADCLL